MIEFFGNDSARWNAVQPLATVVANRLSRSASDDLTLFKALGVGISDLSLGIELYRKALDVRAGPPVQCTSTNFPRLGGEVK